MRSKGSSRVPLSANTAAELVYLLPSRDIHQRRVLPLVGCVLQLIARHVLSTRWIVFLIRGEGDDPADERGVFGTDFISIGLVHLGAGRAHLHSSRERGFKHKARSIGGRDWIHRWWKAKMQREKCDQREEKM